MLDMPYLNKTRAALTEIAGCADLMDETGLGETISGHVLEALEATRHMMEWYNAAVYGIKAAKILSNNLPLNVKQSGGVLGEACDRLDQSIAVIGVGAISESTPPPAVIVAEEKVEVADVSGTVAGFTPESLVAFIQHDRDIQDAGLPHLSDSWDTVLDTLLGDAT